jgi:hypothetical protein
MPHASITISLFLLCASLTAQTPLLNVFGDSTTKSLGRFATRAGDVDRDGYQDFIVGLENMGNGVGGARVYSGRDGRVIHHFTGGTNPLAQMGVGVAPAGDINSDGYADVMISSPIHPKNGISAGHVQIMSGKDGKLIREHYGDGPGDLFGLGVNGIGDINGDGVDDYIIGAPENGDPVNNYGTGYARLYSGKDGKTIHTFKGYEVISEFGFSVAPAGDVNRDGITDIIIGSTLEGYGAGSARVFDGKTRKMLYNFPAPQEGDHFGVCVNSAGDVDADGHADVLVGAANAYSFLKGAVWVFSGRTGKALYHIKGSATSGMLGRWVQGIGDVNNDGHADFIGGDPGDKTGSPKRGSFRCYSGKDGKQLFVIYGDGGGFGVQCDNMGDMNGDGSPELLCCVPDARYKSKPAGMVSIRSLRPVAPFGDGCSARKVAPRLEMTTAVIGKTSIVFLKGPIHTGGILALSMLLHRPTAIGSNCYLHLDLPTAIPVAVFQTDAAGRWSISCPIPNTPGLVGATYAAQSALKVPVGAELTNGLHFTITR